MDWPNKVSFEHTGLVVRAIFYNKMWDLEKWCLDNLSSKGVLWTFDVEHKQGIDVWNFYFAQPDDAIVFRLTHNL